MKDPKVIFLPSMRMDAPALGDRPEPALQAMIRANQRVIDRAVKVFASKKADSVPSSEAAHLVSLYERHIILFELGRDCFPFSDFRYEHFRAGFAQNTEYLRDRYLEAVHREALAIAINCKNGSHV